MEKSRLLYNNLISKIPEPWKLVELFVWANLSFLAVDIYVAHSVVEFKYWPTWIPFVFSLISPLVIIAGWLAEWKGLRLIGKSISLLVGVSSILVGVVGLLLHLDDSFFVNQTLQNLVYTAPFIAPLSYTGIGFLMLLNRLTSPASLEWAHWVVILALAGFAGNFGLSLADHAQNGFFEWEEWIAVGSAALAVSFLVCAFILKIDRQFLWWCQGVMALQVLVGLLGFYYHVEANLHGSMSTLWDNFIYGAPTFAPLLFPNLALLAAIGLWDWMEKLPEKAPTGEAEETGQTV